MIAGKKKQSLYFPEEMLAEIRAEATRMDRSLSWIIQHTWRQARARLMAFPSSTDSTDILASPDPREE